MILRPLVSIWLIAGEGEGGVVDDKVTPTPDPNPSKDAITLTPEQQAHVDALIKKAKDDANRANNLVLGEVEALRSKVKMTTKDREQLEESINAIQAKFRTKEEQDAIDKANAARKHKTEVEELTKEVDTWKNRFTASTIDTAITQAATAPTHKAINPHTVIAILRPQTRLEQEIDADGKPTGNLIPMILFPVKGKDGKKVTLDLPVTEAVKQMSESDDFAHLFEGKGTGGFGGNNAHKRDEKVDLATLAKDPVAWKKFHAEHPELFPK